MLSGPWSASSFPRCADQPSQYGQVSEQWKSEKGDGKASCKDRKWSGRWSILKNCWLTSCWSYAYTCQRTCICLLSLVLVYELYITYVWKSDVTYHYRHFHYRHFHLTGFGCWPLRNDVWADSKEKTVIHWFPMNNNHVWNSVMVLKICPSTH